MPNSRAPHDPLRLQVLGGAALLDATGAPIGQQRRRLALLALVAAAGDSGVSRDRLMAVLSPDSPIESARHALHQLIYYLRQQGGDELFLGTDPLSLNPAVLTSDLREFQEACDQRAFARAVALYRGPFLDGFHLGDSSEFEDWASLERARLAARFSDALLQLAQAADASGERHAAIEWWRKLATLDPLDGRAALGLITALVAAGDTPGAVRQARGHGELVRLELGREPDPGIAAFLSSLPSQAQTGGPTTPQGELETVPQTTTTRSGRVRVVFAVALSAVLVLFGLRALRSSPQPGDTIERIAVLPLVNGSSDTTVEELTGALTQELIASLSRTRMAVIGYYSVERYRGSRPPIDQIGRDLGVDAVATWSVSRQAGQWRVSLDVSRAPSGEGIWSSTHYAIGSLNLGDVAAGAARELASRFGRSDPDIGPRPGAATPHVHEAKLAYLLGMDRLTRGGDDSQYSLAQFERAIALDSSFAPGYAGLAYALLWSVDYGHLPVRAACLRAGPAAQRALELDPNLALAHVTRARVLVHCEWKWNEADEAYRRALAIEPTPATYQEYGWFLSWYLGRFAKGLAVTDTAVALDPQSFIRHMALGWRLLAAGQLDRAEEEARTGLALEPRSIDGPWVLAEVYLLRGDLEAAEREALRVKNHPTAAAPNWSMLGEIYARSSRPEAARAYLATLAATKPMTGAARVAMARTLLALGDRDAALTTLERAVDDGVFIIPHQHYWNAIRDHPRFEVMMSRIGLR